MINTPLTFLAFLTTACGTVEEPAPRGAADLSQPDPSSIDAGPEQQPEDTGSSTPEEQPGPDETPEPTDQDADGVPAPDDCDDGNAFRYPGASELCDGIDNDCDGTIDEDVESVDWFLDADGDGIGGGAPEAACKQPADDWVLRSGDCDDGRADVSPDAPEVCDGLDNDCDGDLDADDEDAVGLVAAWPDADGDGHGRAGASTTEVCPSSPGWATNDDDCDDSLVDVSPSAVEVCMNWTDDNCDGDMDPCTWEADAWLLDGDVSASGTVGERFGQSVAVVGDLDGDDREDVVVVVPDAEVDGFAMGQIRVYTGVSRSGLGAFTAELTPPAYIEGGLEDAIVTSGDLNGDGWEDLIVGLPSMPDWTGGQVVAFYGPLGGELDLIGDADLRWRTGSGDITGFPTALAFVGDIDGDGRGEIALGDSSQNTVYAVDRTEEGDVVSEASTYIYHRSPWARFGQAIAGGDFDGDGRPDLAIGARGAILFYEGTVAGLRSDAHADVTLTGSWDDGFGQTIATVPNAAGGSADELLVGQHAKHSTRGEVCMMVDAATAGGGTCKWRVRGSEITHGLGSHLAALGDVNGDGETDFALGFGNSYSHLHERLAVVYGPLEGSVDLDEVDVILTSSLDGYAFGGGGDIDGDGLTDLVVSSPDVSSARGTVSVFFGLTW